MGGKDKTMKTKMSDKEFKEAIYELAFGDNAINRGFSEEEVVATIKEFAHDSWVAEELDREELNQAAQAVADFRTAQGPDACDDKPNEYFAVMDKAFGRMPTPEEVLKIEELGYQLRKKEQPTHRELVSSLNGIIGFRKDNLE